MRKILDGRDAGRAVHAAWVLAYIAPEEAKKSEGILLEALEGRSVKARILAALTLGRIGADGPRGVALLVDRLKDRITIFERAAVAHALLSLGSASAKALLELLSSKEASRRDCAAYLLGRLGRSAIVAAPALNERLRDDDRFVRVRAAEALLRIDPAAYREAAEAVLRRPLRNGGPDAYDAAVACGRAMREGSIQAKLLERFNETDAIRAETANLALALCVMGPEAGVPQRAWTAKLETMVWTSNTLWEYRYAESLLRLVAMLGPRGRDLGFTLAINCDHPGISRSMELALGGIGIPANLDAEEFSRLHKRRRDDPPPPRLVHMLLHRAGADRVLDPEELSLKMSWDVFAPSARTSADEIVLERIRSGNWLSATSEQVLLGYYEGRSETALLRRAENETIRGIRKFLKSDIIAQRRAAAFALGLPSVDAAVDVSELLEMLKREKDEDTRHLLMVVLWKHRAAVPADVLRTAVVRMFDGPDFAREWAAQRFGEMGKAALPIPPALRKMLRDDYRGPRAAAALALGALEDRDKQTILRLLDMKQNEASVRVRTAVLRALGRIGPAVAAHCPKNVFIDLDKPELEDDESAALIEASLLIRPELIRTLGSKVVAFARKDNLRAVGILETLGPKARPLVPELLAAFRGTKDGSPAQNGIARLLPKIGVDGDKLFFDLLVKGRKTDMRILAAYGPQARGIVPRLIAMIEKVKSNDAFVLDCCDVLGAIGRDAREAIPLLLKLHETSRDPAVYLRCAQAIVAIDRERAMKEGIPSR